MTDKKGYNVTVAGQFYAGSGKDKQLRAFKSEVFFIPETVEISIGRKFVEKLNADGKKIKVSVPNKKTVNGLKAAQHVIQRRLLGDRLSEKYEDFAGVRTCVILNYKRTTMPADQVMDLEKPIDEMSKQGLRTICALESLNTDPNIFASLDDARQAIKMELGQIKPEDAYAPVEETTLPTDGEEGVTESVGAVSSSDGVPTDNEDPAEGLM